MFKKKNKRLGLKASILFGTIGLAVTIPTAILTVSNNALAQSEKVANEQQSSTNQKYLDISKYLTKDGTDGGAGDGASDGTTSGDGATGQPGASGDNSTGSDSSQDEQGTGYDLIPIVDGVSLKVPNFESNKKKADLIASTYRTQPGNVGTDIDSKSSVNNIYNILEIDSKKWVLPDDKTINSRPVIFNLGTAKAYKNNKYNVVNVSGDNGSGNKFKTFSDEELTNKVSLPAFSKANDGEQPITQAYLNEKGVLALQMSLTKAGTTNNNQVTTFYVMISGFGTALDKNSASDSPMLPSDVYVQSVNSVSNTTLLSNIKFTPDGEGSVQPIKSINQSSRVNNVAQGSLSFSAEFKWTIPANIVFVNGFAGIIESSKASSLEGSASGGTLQPDPNLVLKEENATKVSTSWSKDFTFTGFQPSPDFSTTQIIATLGGIIGSIVGVSLIGYGATKLTRFVREKKAS